MRERVPRGTRSTLSLSFRLDGSRTILVSLCLRTPCLPPSLSSHSSAPRCKFLSIEIKKFIMLGDFETRKSHFRVQRNFQFIMFSVSPHSLISIILTERYVLRNATGAAFGGQPYNSKFIGWLSLFLKGNKTLIGVFFPLILPSPSSWLRFCGQWKSR